jgi:cobalamin synthase
MVINRIISPYLPTEILAMVLLSILILATAANHLAGAYETVANLAKGNPFTNSFDRRQVYGLLAVLLIILFKIHSLEVTGESRAFSLLLTPLLARWSLLLFLFGSGPFDDNGVPPIANSIRAWHLVAASVTSLGLALFTAGAQALWVALSLSLFALLARGYLMRRAEGISLANCGALIEFGEALSFTLFASF